MASKVLTVDDSRVMLRILGSVVESLGLEPVAAQNGKQALEALLKCPDEFRLVMLDWNMPVMDGFETLRAMKADPRLRNIPVMMVTTETEHDSVVRAVRAGARNNV
jgi:two-component system chemotaxis response regulator CheY